MTIIGWRDQPLIVSILIREAQVKRPRAADSTGQRGGEEGKNRYRWRGGGVDLARGGAPGPLLIQVQLS